MLEWLKDTKPIEKNSNNLWVIYGKSGSGKTAMLGGFPKPMLYLQFGDNGQRTLLGVKGIQSIQIISIEDLNSKLIDLLNDQTIKTVAVDTFGLLSNEWINTNAIQKKKRMTQQMWGDLKTETEEAIANARKLSEKKIVVLTCHEVQETIESREDEIVPDIRPNVSKGARYFLEAMANFGVHTTVELEEKITKSGKILQRPIHVASVAPNPYYWTKIQKPTNIDIPEKIVNPTYQKIMDILEDDKNE